ncbi:hypothetical protein EP7_000147 [Isosphaeraceae bacterium EP7]
MAGICREIERELATPAGRVSPAALAGHLDDCPACARIAARARAVDDAWSATTPDEPTEPAWDSAWARVALALDTPEPAVLPMVARRGAARLAWIGLAMAAVAVVALTLTLSSGPATRTSVDQVAQVDLPAGEISFLRLDARGGVTVQSVREREVGLGNDIFNAMESEAVPSLAVREVGPADNLFSAPRTLAD